MSWAIAGLYGPMWRMDAPPVVDHSGALHWPVALDAFQRYGKGRHPAALNFGDCLTYAVASHPNRPLLCVGGDFRQTDLDVVSGD